MGLGGDFSVPPPPRPRGWVDAWGGEVRQIVSLSLDYSTTLYLIRL
jgi:hypothetical protein